MTSGVVAVEVVGSLLLWAPIPIAWMWIGGEVYKLTGSLTADLAVAMTGFIASSMLVVAGLVRLDRRWVRLRRQAGHEQREGALNRVIVVSFTFGLVAFYLWFNVLNQGFIIQFMPTS